MASHPHKKAILLSLRSLGQMARVSRPITNSSPIAVTHDVAPGVALITLAADATGQRVAQAIAACLVADPRLASLHLVYDLRDNREGATDADVDRVARAYAPIPRSDALKFTCFITHDAHFHLWAASMDEKYTDRSHLVFDDLTEALQHLTRLDGGMD